MSDLASTSEKERKRAVAAIHWVFSADGTKSERSMADEAINKINDLTFMPLASPVPAESGEPVPAAWQHRGPRGGWITTDEKTQWSERALYLHPPAESAGSPSTSGVGATDAMVDAACPAICADTSFGGVGWDDVLWLIRNEKDPIKRSIAEQKRDRVIRIARTALLAALSAAPTQEGGNG